MNSYSINSMFLLALAGVIWVMGNSSKDEKMLFSSQIALILSVLVLGCGQFMETLESVEGSSQKSCEKSKPLTDEAPDPIVTEAPY